MKRNFSLEPGYAEVSAEGKAYDLHNCYDYQGFEYNSLEGSLHLHWTKNNEYAKESDPTEIILNFERITFFSTTKRDFDVPYTEDSCMMDICISPDSQRADWEALYDGIEDGDIQIRFQSGSALKINSDVAYLKVLP